MILLFAQIVLGGGAPHTTRNPAPGDTVPVPSRADAIRPDTSARPPFVTPSRREARRQAREEARRREKLEETPLPERLARALHLPGAPRRIECVDVSHTGGRQTRVGMVVYEDGRPSPDQYRAYAMPDGGDDYGTLYALSLIHI